MRPSPLSSHARNKSNNRVAESANAVRSCLATSPASLKAPDLPSIDFFIPSIERFAAAVPSRGERRRATSTCAA